MRVVSSTRVPTDLESLGISRNFVVCPGKSHVSSECSNVVVILFQA